MVLQCKPATKSLKRRKRCRQTCRYNPTEAQLEGDCLYACLAYSLDLKRPNRRRMNQIRVAIASWFRLNPEVLAKHAADEAVNPQVYLSKFVFKGWGGIPEVLAFNSVFNQKMEIVDRNEQAGLGGPALNRCDQRELSEIPRGGPARDNRTGASCISSADASSTVYEHAGGRILLRDVQEVG